MRKTTFLLLSLLGALVLGLAACGGDGGEEGERARIACQGTALETDPALPADFPKPGEVTYTKSSKAGPSLVVDGYWDSGLEEAYNEYKEALEGAGYDILFDEIEDHDAEISYGASATTGQVALRDECSEDDVTSVHITNRPK